MNKGHAKVAGLFIIGGQPGIGLLVGWITAHQLLPAGRGPVIMIKPFFCPGKKTQHFDIIGPLPGNLLQHGQRLFRLPQLKGNGSITFYQNRLVRSAQQQGFQKRQFCLAVSLPVKGLDKTGQGDNSIRSPGTLLIDQTVQIDSFFGMFLFQGDTGPGKQVFMIIRFMGNKDIEFLTGTGPSVLLDNIRCILPALLINILFLLQEDLILIQVLACFRLAT
jgi:hypothetical protein